MGEERRCRFSNTGLKAATFARTSPLNTASGTATWEWINSPADFYIESTLSETDPRVILLPIKSANKYNLDSMIHQPSDVSDRQFSVKVINM